jgi:acyl-CoA thioester hydrolase
MKKEWVRVRRRICFYETDAMGIVHHSNYLRFFEEARMHWYLERQVEKYDVFDGERINFAVVEAQARYRSPAKYTEEIETTLQLRQERSIIRFTYEIKAVKDQRLIATGYTTHVPVTKEMRVCRISDELARLIQEEPWTEISP